MESTPIIEENDNENISDILDNAEEIVGVVEQDIVIAGVRSLNGQSGDLTLKTINNTDLVGQGDIAVQTPLNEAQMTAVNSGIDSTKVEQIATNASNITTLQNTKQDNLTQTQLNAVNSGIDQTKVAQIATNTGNISSNTGRITTIEGKIPSAASNTNQLTDKNYVDNSIATNTANYISDNGQPFQSLADLEAYSGPLTNNDYAFVESTDSAGNDIYTRYKYNATTQQWAEEYTISNPNFTSDQWASINSGVTANDVSQIGTNKSDIAGLATSKQDTLSASQLDAVNSGIDATKVTQIATNTNNITSLQTGKQDKLTAGTNIQISGSTISATDTKYTAGAGLTLTGTQFSVNDPAPSGFFTDAGTVENTGTSLTINNQLAVAPKSVQLNGSTEQISYTGKNLASPSSSVLYSNNSSNVVTPTATGYTLSNTSGGVNRQTGVLLVPDLTPYIGKTVRAKANFDAAGGYRLYRSNSLGGDRVNVVVTATSGSEISFVVPSDLGTSPALMFVMLLNSDTANTISFSDVVVTIDHADMAYEPYVGGIPSPNPDYPQNINVVTGEQTVELCGKNILDFKQFLTDRSVSYTEGTDGALTFTLTNALNQNKLVFNDENISVSIQALITNVTSANAYIELYNKSGSRVARLSSTNATAENVSACSMAMNWQTAGSVTVKNAQIELGSTATAYEPFQGQSYTLELGSIELCKIGTYQDYIYKSGADWKVHKEIGHDQRVVNIVAVDSAGASGRDFVSGTGAFFISKNYWDNSGGDYDNSVANARLSTNCGQYKAQNVPGNSQANEMDDGTFCQRSGETNDRIYFRFSALAGKTGNEVKAILQAQGGADFWYILPSPTDITITDANLISQLEALASAQMKAGQNNIISSGTPPNLDTILTIETFQNNWNGLSSYILEANS